MSKEANKFLSHGDKHYRENRDRLMEQRLTAISMEGVSKEILTWKTWGRTF